MSSPAPFLKAYREEPTVLNSHKPVPIFPMGPGIIRRNLPIPPAAPKKTGPKKSGPVRKPDCLKSVFRSLKM
ncbi:MAG: hypothetical protein V3V24_07895, partial [Nitrospinaceae bacterium]